ncbi:hypothetical protein [Lentzea sp. HUAS12]|uniref:hypothetical protein n=1 Tax=Lentzea sp. HUAS12 TaxID=2951806 RepID=UPI00209FAF1F|nr:hypothetical protein [Lentzea sp. HUAS12]USX48146.1 hypothetical protein ND450_21875 [Lentzea sp. HUAS12]
MGGRGPFRTGRARDVRADPAGLEKARRATPPSLSVDWLRGDLTASSIPGVSGTFDLLVDYSVLDDLRGAAVDAMAARSGCSGRRSRSSGCRNPCAAAVSRAS